MLQNVLQNQILGLIRMPRRDFSCCIAIHCPCIGAWRGQTPVGAGVEPCAAAVAANGHGPECHRNHIFAERPRYVSCRRSKVQISYFATEEEDQPIKIPRDLQKRWAKNESNITRKYQVYEQKCIRAESGSQCHIAAKLALRQKKSDRKIPPFKYWPFPWYEKQYLFHLPIFTAVV